MNKSLSRSFAMKESEPFSREFTRYDHFALRMTAFSERRFTPSCLLGTAINPATITAIIYPIVRGNVLSMQKPPICATFVSQEVMNI
jgi:hypothetical protein